MNLGEKRRFLIQELAKNEKRYCIAETPDNEIEECNLLRSLMNVRMPGEVSEEFIKIQDEYLKEVAEEKGIVGITQLPEIAQDMILWQGDITRLKCGAIVNAANSGMTGCYYPCHRCIDNCIHTYAGVQLRNYCAELMEKQGCEEPTGSAKITPAFNLPCEYVIHTVGPIVYGVLTDKERIDLRNCYDKCLEIAEENGVESIAFCCISTGEFHFPNEEAAKIAVQTVREYKQKTGSKIKVIFNVFKDEDREIYERLLR